MKKITDFIVDKKYYILVTVIILSIISLFVSNNVKINNDISKYLPKNSETKKGMDIMDDNFEELKSSNLYIMFKNLKDEEKESRKKELEDIKNVSSVEYDSSSKYNNGKYTLYILNVDDYSDSKVSKDLYKQIKKKYKNESIELGGSIDKENKPVVKTWILIAAVIFAMIILIIMCNSYIEPFLFLFVIGLAIFLNKGTNIMFDSVSNITNAIAAVLQLALSMDYSIMLMNRYTQEKEKNKDNNKAMKKALYNSFMSISSSSVTTIVGLLALIFMSFTIGRDLGLVLAKGVFFSLITIFLCLPALILLFDKLIEKTKKKALHVKLNKLGKFEYKFKYGSLIIFLILFITSFILKGNLSYLYTGAEQDEIAKHFKTNNQMVLIYNNKYEKDVASYCRNINNEEVSQVLCYGNTIGEKLKYNELNNKFSELNKDTNIDEYLIKIIYYYYNNEEISNKMTFNEFVTFINNTVYNNEKISNKMDIKMKNSINRLGYFTDSKKINEKRNINSTSNILEIDNNKTKMLYVLYHKNDVTVKINITDFINFINKDVIDSKDYGSYIDSNTKENIKELNKFTNKNNINTNLNSTELSNIFGIDKNSINNLLLLYYSNNASDYKLSISEFLIGINHIRSYLVDQDITSLEPLISIAKNENNINSTPLNKNYLKAYFSNEQLVDMVYMYSNLDDNYTLTPQQFLHIVLNNYSSYLPEENVNKLKLISLIVDDTLTSNKVKYSHNEISYILGIPDNTVIKLYALIGSVNGYEYKLSPYKLVNFILENKNNPLLSSISEEQFNKLVLVNKIMTSVNENKKFNYTELSNLLGIDKEKTSLLYSLYDINYTNKNYKISLNKFIKFILNDVITNDKYKDNFDNDSINKLQTINLIINSSLKNIKYNNKEIRDILNNLSDIKQSTIDLVYIYYGSINDYNNDYELSIETFVVYLNNKILNNNIFKDFIDDDMRTKIKDANNDIIDNKKLLVSKNYSRMIINTTFDKESKNTFKFIENIKDDLNTKDKEIYLIGDSPMAYDLNDYFASELNFITILTMIAIFVVVACTFKSIIIPLILVLIIECSVFITMSILSFEGSGIYFIAILIVQSILMGATIDYAIVYTSYYKEYRLKDKSVLDSIINAYNNSIHTILTSATILIIVTFIVGLFAEAIAAKICITVSKGTLCSSILILLLLPGILATLDKYIIKK